MNFRYLKYFLTVAREEKISAAAEILHLTQPTLSRQMMELEEQLGVKLFTRGNRKIFLTDEGILLRKRAQEIIDLVEKTESELTLPNEIISGDVYIGSGETYAIRDIADIIKNLQSAYPEIKFHLYSGNAEDVTERLDKGLLDFGIVIGPANVTKYDSLRLPAMDVWGVYMRQDSPLAALSVIRPENLWDVPLILSRQRLVSDEISNWIQRDYRELNVVNTFNLLYNASLLVEAGIGYALSLDKLIDTTGTRNLCFRPLEPQLESHLDIVWKKSQVFTNAAGVFLERVRNSLTELPQ